MKLFEQICDPQHILASFHRIKEKWFDPYSERYSINSTGLDGLTLQDFERNLDENLDSCRELLLNPGRDFYPQILCRIPKKDPGKFRDIYLMTVRDKVAHKAIVTPLETALDRHFYPNLYAFRRGKYYGSIAAARKVRDVLKGHQGNCFVLKADISEYFDSIDPKLLMKLFQKFIPEEKEVLQHLDRFLRHRRLVKGILHTPLVGVPTGSSLSPFCANLYLHELDQVMFREGYAYLRYCDDLLLLSPDLKVVEKGKKIIEDILGAHALKLSPEKTTVYRPHEPFDYLGYRFDTCEVHVGDKALKTFHDWIYDILPRRKFNDFPNETPEQRKELLKKILGDLNTGKLTSSGTASVDKHQIPWIRSFPIVDNDRRFREMDRFIKNRIRMLITRRASAKNYKLVPEEWFRELGYKSLTGAYHRFIRRRSLAPYYGWRRYFGSNLMELGSQKKKKGPLKQKIRRLKENYEFFKKAIKGEI